MPITITGHTAVPYLDLIDQAGDPAVLGRLQRNGDILRYYEGNAALQVTGLQRVRRASNGSAITLDTDLSNDDTITLPVGISETWEFLLSLGYTGGTTEDFKIDFSIPTGASGTYSIQGAGTGGGNLPLHGVSLTTATGIGYTGIDTHALIRGTLITDTNAGNFVLRWAQNTSGATSTNILAGTELTMWRVA